MRCIHFVAAAPQKPMTMEQLQGTSNFMGAGNLHFGSILHPSLHIIRRFVWLYPPNCPFYFNYSYTVHHTPFTLYLALLPYFNGIIGFICVCRPVCLMYVLFHSMVTLNNINCKVINGLYSAVFIIFYCCIRLCLIQS